MKQVIIVNGRPRSGKDLGISFMREHLKYLGYRSEHFSSIDPIKKMLSLFVDISQKTEADRKLLSFVGDAMQEHSDFRTNHCFLSANEFFDLYQEGVVFIQFREPELIHKIKEKFNEINIPVLTLLIQSNNSLIVNNNPSDSNTDEYDYDKVFINNGTKAEYHKTCRDLIEDLFIKDLIKANQHRDEDYW